MHRVETLLRNTLTDRARNAPTGPVRLHKLASRRRRIALAALAASGAVVLIAIGVGALGATRGPTTTSPHHHDPHLPTPASLPKGSRLASYGAVSVHVPADLRTRTSLCGRDVEREVVASDGASRLCPVVARRLSPHPGTVVWFSSYGASTPYSGVSTSPERLGGQRVERGYATDSRNLGTGVSGVVKLPDEGVIVGVTAPTRAAVDQLLNSIHIAALNALGCAAHLQAAVRLAPGPLHMSVPSKPYGAIRCEYANSGTTAGMLVGSYLLDRSDTTRIADALNNLSPDPCHCEHGGTPAPGHSEIVYFRSSNGWTLRITGTIGSNLDSYTNGARTVANYDGTVMTLLAHLTHQV